MELHKQSVHQQRNAFALSSIWNCWRGCWLCFEEDPAEQVVGLPNYQEDEAILQDPFENLGRCHSAEKQVLTQLDSLVVNTSCALGACMDCSRWQPLRPSSLRPTSSDNFNIITLDHLLKNNVFVGYTTYFQLQTQPLRQFLVSHQHPR